MSDETDNTTEDTDNTTEDTDETVEVYRHTESVGARLKAAREERNIAITDIAKWLKLDVKTIIAIEEDNTKVLSQPVYTVGYIRSYAKLVELPADQLATDYLQTHETSEVSLPEYQKEKSTSHFQKVAESLPKSFTISARSQLALLKRYGSLSGALVVLVAMSWFSLLYYKTDDMPLTNTSQTPADPSSQSLSNLEVLSPNDAVPIDNDTLARLQGESGKTITKQLPLNKRERSDSEFMAPLDSVGSLKSNQITAQLSLSFSADSWVDIKDATGKSLVRSLGLKGATKEVKGVAPFEVIIGYGPGVEIKYNGKVFDFSQFQGKKQPVARFTLSPPL